MFSWSIVFQQVAHLQCNYFISSYSLDFLGSVLCDSIKIFINVKINHHYLFQVIPIILTKKENR